MSRKLWIVTALVALLLSTLACSIDLVTDDTPPTQVPPTQVPPPTAVPGGAAPGGGAATLNVVNNSGTTIFYLYVSPSTSTEWGDDQLGASTISAGGSFTLAGITPGTYDLKAEDSSHNVRRGRPSG